MPRVLIVGGGISGLSTAWYLAKYDIRATIVERANYLGGLIKTELIDGCVAEAGPDSFLTTKTAAKELAEELGLSQELVGSNDHQRATFIWKRGRMVKLPDGMTMMVPGKIGPILKSDLLSWPGKLRASFDLFRRPTGVERDVSVSDFVLEHYGREVLDYIAEPMLAGVYGGDPAELSALSVTPQFVKWEARYGSLTRATKSELKQSTGPLFTTLRRGLQSLTDELIRQLQPEVIYGAVEKIEQGYRVRVNGDWIEADHVVVACRAAAVLPNLFPEIPYNSATVTCVGYRKADVPRELPGFGFLVPRIERTAVSAGTWVSHKFNHRVPDDKVLLRLFTTGGKADILREVGEKLGIAAEPLFLREHHWPHAMPQYCVGHTELVKIIEAMLKDLPGLHVAGNAYQGIGIPDCIRMGRQVAERIASQTP
ncbi:MAG TPA: protoporphyrinogen oxidase [Bryobacteraceae bacterium]|nr:protoporphyrinogen oxidase [Bryobacteraceae bacterium]